MRSSLRIPRSGAVVPRGDDLDDFHAVYGGSMVGGAIESQLYPDDLTLETAEELAAWKQEIRERMARRRPCGFAPWPDDAPGELRRVA